MSDATQPHLQPTSQGDLPQPGGSQVHACWNEVGVYGSGKCPELPKFIHCRNCPVYSTAGVQLLDRALSPEYRREWTAHFAQEKRHSNPGKVSAVVFRIAREWLALPTQAFQEVAERRPIHSLPHRKKGIVLGLVNIRGELLICVSLGRLLSMDELPTLEELQTSSHRLLVVIWDGHRFAFPVDEVHGIHRFQPDELKDPPATIARSNLAYTRGVFLWRSRSTGFLDPDPLFSTLNRSLS